MTEASAPVASTASRTVLNTGSSMWVVPPLPGVTPPTTFVPYSTIWVAWKVPCWPVKPCTMTLVFLLTKTLMLKSLGLVGAPLGRDALRSRHEGHRGQGPLLQGVVDQA